MKVTFFGTTEGGALDEHKMTWAIGWTSTRVKNASTGCKRTRYAHRSALEARMQVQTLLRTGSNPARGEDGGCDRDTMMVVAA